MWFAVLGPLLIHDGETAIDVPKGRQRVLLAALLLHAGNPVAAGELAEVVWDGSLPSGAAVTLRSHVSRLRRVLGQRAGARLVTRHPGYLLQAGQDEVDVLLFRRLCRDGGAALREGAWARAHTVLGEALALWRGAPLADIPSESLRRSANQDLDALRLQAEEWRIDAALHLGRHAEVLPALQSLAAQHPLMEAFHGHLMLALYRCGRQADALTAYQRAREVLVAELGIEPGPGLRDLHQQILSASPGLVIASPAQPAEAEHQRTAPRQLPSVVAGFTGRAAELKALTRILDDTGAGAPGTVVISAIGGTAGVGKTALAIHWAHQVAARFPDGQLYVNLRGYDPDQPMPAADALAGFLRALGVPGQDIAPGEDERAARYRSLLADKKMLIVLDNARSAEQVRPLLPGTASCAVVVTSRDSLAGLVALHGAARVELDLLAPPEAARLLRALIGPRAGDDPGAAAELAVQCCRLPLALRVAAELAAARPDVPLAGLVTELADQQRRLDLLDAGGDPRTAVRAVFSWSHRHLDNDTAAAFRLAGLHPGADFDPYAVAALTGTTLEQTRAVLDALTRAHLVQPAGPGRYGMHDLLRAYARELAGTPGSLDDQDAALARLLDHYLHTASAAMDTLYPAERHRRPRIPAPGTPVPPVAEPDRARAWLDAERATMVAVTVHAARHGYPSHATRLSSTLFRYLDYGGHYPEAITVHSHARAAAQHTADQSAEAQALNCLAVVHWRQGRYQQADDHYRQALALSRQAGDRTGQARVLTNLGIVANYQGRYQEAISLHRQAMVICRETGDQFGTATALNSLSLIEKRQGRYDLAARHLRQALAIAADIGARDLECGLLVGLGNIGMRQGRTRPAARHLHQALALSREIGFRDMEAEALTRIGDLCLRQGHLEEAATHLHQALAVYREIGGRSSEADALNSLGEVLAATGQPDRASAEYAAALALAARSGDKYQQARAHYGLGQACRADGDPEQARHHWEQALALFTELGTPEAGLVGTQLAAADEGSDQEPEAPRLAHGRIPEPGAVRRGRRGNSPLVRLPASLLAVIISAPQPARGSASADGTLSPRGRRRALPAIAGRNLSFVRKVEFAGSFDAWGA